MARGEKASLETICAEMSFLLLEKFSRPNEGPILPIFRIPLFDNKGILESYVNLFLGCHWEQTR